MNVSVHKGPGVATDGILNGKVSSGQRSAIVLTVVALLLVVLLLNFEDDGDDEDEDDLRFYATTG